MKAKTSVKQKSNKTAHKQRNNKQAKQQPKPTKKTQRFLKMQFLSAQMLWAV